MAVRKARKKTPGKKNATKRQAANQQRFLAAYAECGTIVQAAEIAAMSRLAHHQWMNGDPTYPPRFYEAQQEADERLEAEARRRAVEGLKRIRFHNGQPIKVRNPKTGKQEIYVEHEYSDSILLRMLSAHLPKYRDTREKTIIGKHTHQHSGEIDHVVRPDVIDVSRLPPELRRALLAELERLDETPKPVELLEVKDAPAAP